VGDHTVLGARRLDTMQYGFGALERLYETSDGWLCVAVKPSEEIAALARVLEIDGPLLDAGARLEPSRYDDYALSELLAGRFRSKATAEWIAATAPLQLPVIEPRPHQNLSYLLDPLNLASGRSAECYHQRNGWVREVGTLVTISDAERAAHRVAPRLGEHTDEVLLELGYGETILCGLRSRHVIS
jgi:crotonobetainyl-CoA:carnitine CoA-transferase CaiB-like acyl-CoA transferase